MQIGTCFDEFAEILLFWLQNPHYKPHKLLIPLARHHRVCELILLIGSLVWLLLSILTFSIKIPFLFQTEINLTKFKHISKNNINKTICLSFFNNKIEQGSNRDNWESSKSCTYLCQCSNVVKSKNHKKLKLNNLVNHQLLPSKSFRIYSCTTFQ